MLSNKRIQFNKPILRLKHAEDFDLLPPALTEQITHYFSLDQWSRDRFKIETTEGDESYIGHYKSRIRAIDQGISLLLDTFPERCGLLKAHRVTLRHYLAKKAEDCISHLEKLPAECQSHIGYYQNSLANYVDLVKTVLASEMGLSKAEVVAALSRAEEFALLDRPRPAICTIVSSPKASSLDYVAVIDKPENPYSEAVKKDLQIIRNHFCGNRAEADPQLLPEWFSILKDYEQALLRNLLVNTVSTEDLEETANAFSSKLRVLPLPANYGSHVLLRNFETSKDDLAHLLVEEIRSSHIASRDVRKNKDVRKVHAISNLKHEVKSALIRKIKTLGPVIGQLKDGDTLTLPLLLQTLVTPMPFLPDRSLDKDKTVAIAHLCRTLSLEKLLEHPELKDIRQLLIDKNITLKFEVISTNHSLNYGRYFVPTTPASETAADSRKLVALAQSKVGEETHSLLAKVAKELDKYTTSMKYLFSTDRELHLSSLEQLAVASMGGLSLGSCVSGKDRKAIEVMYTDAMKIYYSKYGCLYELDDTNENKARFAEIFTEIFTSNHHQALAEQNAPGAFGTKTPYLYLPEYLKAAIRHYYADRNKSTDVLKEIDLLASLNEIKHIHSISIKNEIKNAVYKPVFSTVDYLQKNQLSSLITASCSKIEAYLANFPKERFRGLFSNSTIVKQKLTTCLNLLKQESLGLNHKIIVLYVLLMDKDMLALNKQLAEAIGFPGVIQAKQAVGAYIDLNIMNSRFIHRKIDDLAKDLNNKRCAPDSLKKTLVRGWEDDSVFSLVEEASKQRIALH